MKKKYQLLYLLVVFVIYSCVRKPNNTYSVKEEKTLLWENTTSILCEKKHGEREATKLYRLNTERLKELLDSADNLSEGEVQLIQIPDDKGALDEYEIKPNYETPVDVISDFPEIRSYSGKSNLAELQLVITPEGNLFTLTFTKKKLYISNYCIDNEQIYYVH